MSVWLHDVGKLVVPLEVMDKESRLGPALERVEGRFREMLLLDKIALLEGRPYKPGMPAERALGILHSMVEEGGVDGETLALFEQSKAWEDAL